MPKTTKYRELAIKLAKQPNGSLEVINNIRYPNPFCGKGAATNEVRITALNWHGLVAINVLTLRNYDDDVHYYEKAYLFDKAGTLINGIKLDRSDYHKQEFRIANNGYEVYDLVKAAPVDMSYVDELLNSIPLAKWKKQPHKLKYYPRGKTISLQGTIPISNHLRNKFLIQPSIHKQATLKIFKERAQVTVEQYSEFMLDIPNLTFSF